VAAVRLAALAVRPRWAVALRQSVQQAPAFARLAVRARLLVVAAAPGQPRLVVGLVGLAVQPPRVVVPTRVAWWAPLLTALAAAKPVSGWAVPFALAPGGDYQGGRQIPACQPLGFCRLRENYYS